MSCGDEKRVEMSPKNICNVEAETIHYWFVIHDLSCKDTSVLNGLKKIRSELTLHIQKCSCTHDHAYVYTAVDLMDKSFQGLLASKRICTVINTAVFWGSVSRQISDDM